MLLRSAGIIGFQIRNMQGGIDEFDDIVEDRERHITTTQTHQRLEKNQKSDLCHGTLCRTECKETFNGRWDIRLFQVLGREYPFKARVGVRSIAVTPAHLLPFPRCSIC